MNPPWPPLAYPIDPPPSRVDRAICAIIEKTLCRLIGWAIRKQGFWVP